LKGLQKQLSPICKRGVKSAAVKLSFFVVDKQREVPAAEQRKHWIFPLRVDI
jgi:hypothetical protein